jgi:DNA polymerase III delta subunit
MTERQLKDSLKSGEIQNQYLLIGDEPILIDRALNTIKETLRIEESFDLDRFSLPDATIENIISKLFLMPFNSKKRLLVVKNLESVANRDLDDFANAVKRSRSGNCLILTYQLKKGNRYYESALKRLAAIFPGAECVVLMPERGAIRKWIQSKIRRDGLNLNGAMVDYLEEEFNNDITGLKNEFEKIENYLHEAGSIGTNSAKDLAQGLCNYDRYHMVDAFLNGRSEALRIFEELQPYLATNAILVDAVTRGVISRARGRVDSLQASRSTLQEMLEELTVVDRKIKTSSIFTRLLMELFILHNAGTFRNGAVYGR